MTKLLFLALLAIPAWGQSAVINNFTALVKGVTIGTTHCYFWGRSPVAGQVQIACYTSGVILKNTIQTVQAQNEQGCFPFTNGNICWLMTPGAVLPAVNYQIMGSATGGTEVMISGSF